MNYSRQYGNKTSEYYSFSRHELLKYVPQGVQHVLDVGCGTGNFGKMLKDTLGCTVWGIEPDLLSSEEAGRKIDYVINDVFNHSTLEKIEKKFDCIFFNDVLEHLDNPEEALSFCKNIIKPNGFIIASIPNLRFSLVLEDLLFKKDFIYQDSGVLDRTHLRFFTQKSIYRMFSQSGYNVDLIEGINIQPLRSRRLKLFKYFFPNYFSDINFLQFAIVASYTGI